LNENHFIIFPDVSWEALAVDQLKTMSLPFYIVAKGVWMHQLKTCLDEYFI